MSQANSYLPLPPFGPDPLHCDDDERRQEVRQSPDWNGIDFVEVSDEAGKLLTVYFIDEVPAGLKKENILILGGRRIEHLQVLEIEVCDAADPRQDDCLRVILDRGGDFSTYTLCIVSLDERKKPVVDVDPAGERRYRPYPGLDVRYACAEFHFRVNCASDQDCGEVAECLTAELPTADIHYLAKDYGSFRQMLLDRLALTLPDWKERHVPDLGITLVELLAYTGDTLSYYQDAVATEAYLDTARQRISVRRHARLVDYVMHEGLNARAWVALTVNVPELVLPVGKFYFSTPYSQAIGAANVVQAQDLASLPPGQYEVFEPLLFESVQEVTLRQAHNRIQIYTWGDELCCLPKGTTSTVLVDGQYVPPQPVPADPKHQQKLAANDSGTYQRELSLRPGDALLFQEVISPTTGLAADADPSHRQVVRLTKVWERVDALYHVPLLEVEWALEDALTFPLCISSTGQPPECAQIENASIAIGNLILVDHGRTQPLEPLGPVPLKDSQTECADCPAPDRHIPGRYRPQLSRPDLTYADPLPGPARPGAQPPAAALLQRDPRQGVPQVDVRGVLPGPDGEKPLFDLLHPPQDWQGPTGDLADLVETWTARADLLDSEAEDRDFTVEMDNERRAWLRFGDGDLGSQPPAGMGFYARYRVGVGQAGNVGAGSISVLVLDGLQLDGVSIEITNPLPAWGGMEPEPLEQVRLLAPYSFRSERLRAVTADDYAELTMRQFGLRLQRAAARLQWTGSFYEACVVVDPLASQDAPPLGADSPLLAEIHDYLMDYRRMGHDLVIKPAQYVPVHLSLRVCVLPGYLKGHVKTALLEQFSNRRLPDGELGFFHPDRLTFGQGVALSQVVAAARGIAGVESVVVERLERYGSPSKAAIQGGLLPMDLFEIPRLDNDPNQPDNGRLELILEGGR